MARKFLEDIGIADCSMGIDPEDERWEKWNKETEMYGFPTYETWDLEHQFYIWLYERVKRYLEVNDIDLNYHNFDYKGQKYSQKEIIEKILCGCELYFSRYKGKELSERDEEKIKDIPWLWATVIHTMWW